VAYKKTYLLDAVHTFGKNFLIFTINKVKEYRKFLAVFNYKLQIILSLNIEYVYNM